MRKCLLCGNKLKKKRLKFCCNKHKDRYHNINNPRGIFAHLNSSLNDSYKSADNDAHPLDSYSLGQE